MEQTVRQLDADDFDYAPYLAAVERMRAELDRRVSHAGPWLTTEQFLEKLRGESKVEIPWQLE